jgi:hypothetical protein
MTTINSRQLLKLFNEQTKAGIVVRLVTREVPEKRDAKGRLVANKYTFAEDVCALRSVTDYGEGQIYVSLTLSTGTSASAYVQDDFQFIILNDEEKKEFEDSLTLRRLDHLHNHITHSGSVAAWAEFFVVNEKDEVLPGDLFSARRGDVKQNPYGKISAYGNGSTVEFQTTYNGCLAGTIDSMAYGLKSAYDQARAKFPGAKMSPKSLLNVPTKVLSSLDEKSLPLKKREVKNAYGFKSNNAPEMSARACQTAFQFQLHGLGGLTDDKAKEITKVIDATLGVACVSLLAKYSQVDRVKLGGLPGDYLAAGNHLEYYGLGNTWMIHPMCANLVFDFARKCAMFGEKGFGKHWKASEEEVIACMMEMNVDLSREILSRNKEIMLKIFKAAWPICRGESAAGVPNLSNDIKPEKAQEVVWDVFIHGIDSVLGDISSDMSTNWTLDGSWISHSEGDDKNVWRTINARHGSRTFPNQVVYG